MGVCVCVCVCVCVHATERELFHCNLQTFRPLVSSSDEVKSHSESGQLEHLRHLLPVCATSAAHELLL